MKTKLTGAIRAAIMLIVLAGAMSGTDDTISVELMKKALAAMNDQWFQVCQQVVRHPGEQMGPRQRNDMDLCMYTHDSYGDKIRNFGRKE